MTERAIRAAEALRNEFGILGRRPVQDDFMRICASWNIFVPSPGMIPKLDAIAAVLPVNGFAFRIDDRPCILLRSIFDGGEFNIRTAFHELGHVVLGHLDAGAPTLGLFEADIDGFDRQSEVNETEADVFADFMLVK